MALTEVQRPNSTVTIDKVDAFAMGSLIMFSQYMTAYAGGETMYSIFGHASMSVELLTTTDGRHWTPVDPARRVVSRGGGSESDIAFAPDGSLFALIRNEAG